MPIRAAEAFKTLASESQPFRFVCLSGDFVDQNEKGSNLYVNIKGRMEKQLSELASPAFQTVCLRAGGIIPTKEVRKSSVSLLAQKGLPELSPTARQNYERDEAFQSVLSRPSRLNSISPIGY